MQNHAEIMEDQLEDYSGQLRSLNSFIAELNSTTKEHGTDRALFEHDLREAEHNVQYYQDEIARLKKELGELGSAKPSDIAKPADVAKPGIKKPGILALVLTPIGFLAGAVFGSRLKSRRAKKDN